MGCSGSRVSPAEVPSPGVDRTADRAASSQQGSGNRAGDNDAQNSPHGAIADESNQGNNNVRESVSERSMRMTDGANRPAGVPVRGLFGGTQAADNRQASTEFTAEARDSQALRETDDDAMVEQSRRVQTIVVQPSTSKGKALRSAGYSTSDGSSQASFQPVRDKVAPTTDGRRKDKLEAIAETNRHVRHQDTSTTDLQPDRPMRGKSPDVVYKDRIVEKIVHVDRVVSVPVYKDKIVEKIVHVDRVVSVPVYRDKIVEKIVRVQVPQVSDVDMVVQAAKYLEHTLRVNFSATGDGLGQCVHTASSVHGRLENPLTNVLRWIVKKRNSIVHNAETNRIHDRRTFVNKFQFAWLSLKDISCCGEHCNTCKNADLFLNDM